MKPAFIFLISLFVFSSCHYRTAEVSVNTSNSFSPEQISLGGVIGEELIGRGILNASDDSFQPIFAVRITQLLNRLEELKQVDKPLNENYKEEWEKLKQDILNQFEDLTVEDTKSWMSLNDSLLKYSGEVVFADELEKIIFNSKIPETINEKEIKSVFYTNLYDRVYLNIYGSSTVEYEHTTGGKVRIIQDTQYPYNGSIILKVELQDTRYLDLYIRIPEWADMSSVTVKGVKYTVNAGQYTEVAKKWENGDEVEIILGMRPVAVKNESGEFAFQYGSLLLEYEKLPGNNVSFTDSDPYKYLQYVSPPGENPTFTFSGLAGKTIVLQSQFSEGEHMERTPWIPYSATAGF